MKDVLVVDDDAERACGIARALRQHHVVRVAIGLRDAVHELARKVPDAIICAFDMPPYRGDALLQMIAIEHPKVRRILFSGGPVLVDHDAAHAVVGKPTEAAELLAAIGED